MYNESTTIVDAVATTDGYALSIKAGDLYIAYEVVRRHVDEAGARHFAQLTKSEITEDGYAFTFDTGDVFTCTGADEYPASETLSDESSGGGSGGGVLVVHEVQHQGETLVSGTLPNVAGYAYSSTHEEGRIDLTVVGIGDTIPLSSVVVTIGTETYSGDSDLVVQRTDTLRVKLKGEQQYPESAITGLSITVVESYTALDHTWQEISDAGFAVLNDHGGILVASGIYAVAGAYGVEFYICYDDGQGSVGINVFNFSTSSVSGYPARTP